MRIFLLAGEPSGDLHGAHLALALRARHPAIALTGVGGRRMRAAGVALLAESDHWGAIGIPDAVRKIPAMFVHARRLEHHLRADPPDVLLLIDFGAFNMHLLRRLHGSGQRVVYFIPPGCWSRARPAGRLPWMVEGIATPFPWSADNLRAAGAPARIEFVGHPVLEYTRDARPRDAARALLGIDPARGVVALVPGSRRGEIRYLMPPFLAAVRLCEPRPLVLLTVAPSLGEAALRALLPDDLDVRLLDGIDYGAIGAADAALVASGTATLELACLGLPMVVAYRGSWVTWLQYRLLSARVAERFVSLPNILAAMPVVPELLQADAIPAKLAAALIPLLTDTPARRAQCAAFARIRTMLGDGDACARTAELVLSVARK